LHGHGQGFAGVGNRTSLRHAEKLFLPRLQWVERRIVKKEGEQRVGQRSDIKSLNQFINHRGTLNQEGMVSGVLKALE
jgi:hypothetical protein